MAVRVKKKKKKTRLVRKDLSTSASSLVSAAAV